MSRPVCERVRACVCMLVFVGRQMHPGTTKQLQTKLLHVFVDINRAVKRIVKTIESGYTRGMYCIRYEYLARCSLSYSTSSYK